MPAPPRPTRLGPYDVGVKIGGGGMATIYLGLGARKDALEKLAALKVIKDELVHDEQHVAMFLDEARILSRLAHPHIIRTLEFGVSGQDRFIAMELLLGRPLEDLWQRTADRGKTLDFTVSAWLAARVAEGLHHAHELRDENGTHLQVIHRDVNPSNIFITYTGQVKLIDFGLAKSIRRRAKSAEGIVKGKVPYLSPEQVTEASIDRRSDVYTLGTTLWELTTGKRLFKRKSDVETIMAIRRAEIPDPREANPEYPDALWAIVKRSLAPDRSDRYPTAEAMRADLDKLVKSRLGDAPGKPRAGAVVKRRLEETMNDLFPGERERQLAWLLAATDHTTPPPSHTVRPPAPLPEVEAQRDPPNEPPPPEPGAPREAEVVVAPDALDGGESSSEASAARETQARTTPSAAASKTTLKTARPRAKRTKDEASATSAAKRAKRGSGEAGAGAAASGAGREGRKAGDPDRIAPSRSSGATRVGIALVVALVVALALYAALR